MRPRWRRFPSPSSPLLTECLTAGGAFAGLEPDCDRLNPYAVTFRYPVGSPDPTEAEGRAAVAAARRVYDAVRAALAPPPPSAAPPAPPPPASGP